MATAPDSTPFCCPLCSSTVYEQVVVQLSSGKSHASSLFQCAGCSVIFRDKSKFTRRAKFEPGKQFTPSGRLYQMPGKDQD